MKKKAGLVAALMVAAAAAFACSSSSSGGGGGNQCVTGGPGVASACTSCLQNSCGSQVSGVESGCSDFINCACPNGTLDSNLVTSCESKEMEASCTNALSALSSCETSKCASACAVGADSGAGSSSGGSSGGGSGSSSGSGSDSGTGEVIVSCVQGGGIYCTQEGTVQAGVASSNAMCSAGGNTPGMGCPTTGLIGCCVNPGGTHAGTCYYTATVAGPAQSACTSPMAWTTTVP